MHYARCSYTYALFSLAALAVLIFSAASAEAQSKPTVTTSYTVGPPAQAVFTARDTGSGMAEVLVTRSENADTVVPPFTVGSTDPIPITSTKIDQTQPMKVDIRLTNLAGRIREFSFNDGPAPAGVLVISEFRYRGLSGANDEFIEIYNNSGGVHGVSASSGTGYAIAVSPGTLRCTIPNGTVIPDRGHFLCTNSVAYSLSNYGGTGAAAGDATYAVNIPENVGLGLFNSSTTFTLANRIDAVGTTAEANTTFKEGTGLPTLVGFSIDYAWVRDTCGKGGSITTPGVCPTGGVPKDTDNNASDFYFVDTNGTSAGGGQRLGAPGPENLTSPIQRNSEFPINLLDSTVSAASPPNRVRDFTSDPANNSTFGTLDMRRRIVNDTGGNVTRLRFRVIDLTTFPAPSGFADLRPRSSLTVVVAGVNDSATCTASGLTAPCTVSVTGTTLEQPPGQPNGGGFNSSLSLGTITLGTPLAPGASVNARFLIGIQQNGTFRFLVNVEALP